VSSDPIRIAYLFPVFGLIDGDICRLADELGAESLIFRVPPGDAPVDPASFVGDPDTTIAATIGLGNPATLARIATEARVVDPDVVAWGCTSGSFLADQGTLGSQAGAMAAAAGVPATTTSLAILHVLKKRRITKVCVVTPYVPEMGEPFIAYLRRHGVEVLGHEHCGRANDEQIGRLTSGDILPLARKCWQTDAQALIIPCTAVRRGDIVEAVDAEFGVPAILANMATLEHAVDLVRGT
jgi:maleate cis-trans isomerase